MITLIESAFQSITYRTFWQIQKYASTLWWQAIFSQANNKSLPKCHNVSWDPWKSWFSKRSGKRFLPSLYKYGSL